MERSGGFSNGHQFVVLVCLILLSQCSAHRLAPLEMHIALSIEWMLMPPTCIGNDLFFNCLISPGFLMIRRSEKSHQAPPPEGAGAWGRRRGWRLQGAVLSTGHRHDGPDAGERLFCPLLPSGSSEQAALSFPTSRGQSGLIFSLFYFWTVII